MQSHRHLTALLRRSPLALSAVAFAVGLYGPLTLPRWAVAALVALLPILFLGVLIVRRGRPRAEPLLLGIPFLLGVGAGRGPPVEPVELPSGPALAVGVIAGTPRPQVRGHDLDDAPPEVVLRFPFRLESWNGSPAQGRVTLLLPESGGFGRGDRLRFACYVEEGDASLYLKHRAHLYAVEAGSDPRGALDRLRARIRGAWRSRFDRNTSAWLAALVLGDRGLLPEGMPLCFRRIGQTHVLAISGMHVSLILAIILFPLRRASRLPRRAAHLLAAGFVALYGGVTGADAPVLRAVVFGVLATSATLRGRDEALGHRLALTLLLLGATSVGEAAGAGFVLSFAAVVGIALAQEEREPAPAPRLLRRAWLWTGRSLRISLGAWLGASIPLVFWTPEFVPWSPIFALLFVPVLAALLASGLVALLPPLPLLEPALEWVMNVEIRVFEELALLLDRLPLTPWSLPPIPPIALALALASAAAALVSLARRGGVEPRAGRWPHLLLALALVVAVVPRSPPGATLLDLGRGQGFLLRGKSATLLFDAGSLDRYQGGAIAIRDELRRHGLARLDLMVLSHAHADHMNALLALPDLVTLGAVAVPPRFGEAEMGRALLAWLERRAIEVIVMKRGDRLDAGGFRIEALHPPVRYPALLPYNPNDDSLVVRVRGEGFDGMACGDLQEGGLAMFAEPPRTEFLILPHHGRASRGLDPWLRRIAPRFALIAAPGEADPRVRALLEQAGVPWASSGGAVPPRLRSTPSGWTIVPAPADGASQMRRGTQ